MSHNFYLFHLSSSQWQFYTILLVTSLGTQRCTGHSWLIVTPAVYPHFYMETNFSLKNRPTQFRISNPIKEHSRDSPEVPNQNLRQIGPGVSELWSDKQTNKDYNFTYLDLFGSSLIKLWHFNCLDFHIFFLFRLQQDPFPLYPGEMIKNKVSLLRVVPALTALK